MHLAKEQHDYGPSKRAAVYQFFARQLGMGDQPEDLARIAIEEPSQMECFNSAHPLPPGAISGSAAVVKALASLRARSRS